MKEERQMLIHEYVKKKHQVIDMWATTSENISSDMCAQ